MTSVEHFDQSDPALQKKVFEALCKVKDPEIPSVSVVDLGMLHEISTDGKEARISLIPTFLGCPALDIIKENARNEIVSLNLFKTVLVEFIFTVPWTTDRISAEGRQKLKEYGIAPPPKELPGGGWAVDCPYCGSPYTTVDNLFGPAACRSILYCRACKNPFEAMKPVLPE